MKLWWSTLLPIEYLQYAYNETNDKAIANNLKFTQQACKFVTVCRVGKFNQQQRHK
jgi:hypothetical protein